MRGKPVRPHGSASAPGSFMGSPRRLLGIFLLASLASIVVLGGCKSYLDDSKSRTAGEFTDDVTIQFIVKKRLIGAPDVRGLRINVEIRKGVVTLFGNVRSEEERTRALEIAAGVPNVVRVVDRLQVPQEP